ncbi:RNA pyrophosphohydrolase [Telmatospirillum sp. J64-1]|uniref:RNA pyrophosphohydrolase n=1 Tax=Telmatospirillum sp. J64-1 TaxID=2502183 RepID=UPI00115CD7C3|nr:RNA pyrophosphohydrolase [Telmatospirillum sp. J64-1]
MADVASLPYRLGVGIVLFNDQGLVLAAKRIDTPGDAWQMPQGGIDEGEDPRSAALRELEEEVGTAKAEIIAESAGWLSYDLPEDIRAKVWKGRYRGQKQKWFAMRFLGRDTDIDIATTHPEFSDWKWLPLDSLPGLIVPFKRPLYDQVVAEFLPLARRLAGHPS